jgi:nitrite reductase/ring-hydroxylating ferredoxin subunit
MMVPMQAITAVDEIPAEGVVFEYKDGPFDHQGIVVRTSDGSVRAFKNECRHLAVPLDEREPGQLWDSHRRYLVCNAHGARYRPDDGLCVSGPCRGSHLKTLPVVILDGEVYLEIQKLGGFFDV